MVAGLSSDGKVVYELSVPEVDHPEAIVAALLTESRSKIRIMNTMLVIETFQDIYDMYIYVYMITIYDLMP